MVIAGIVLLSLLLLINIFGFALLLNWNFQNALKVEQTRLYTAQVIASNKQLEAAARATLDVVEALMNGVKQLLSRRSQHPMRNAEFFTTDDGKITAQNLNEFLEKLEASEDYKDVAADLRKQLEAELGEDFEDIDDELDDDLDEDTDEHFIG